MAGFGRLVSAGFLWLASSAQAADSCVVLQYHHFSEQTPRVTSVTPAQFDAHLDHLAENNFVVLPLSQVVETLRGGGRLPENCVSLTVDDAYDSVYEQAFPRIRAREWPMTLFVNTGAVDDGVSAYLDWNQLREMAAAGVEIGNHSNSHAHLVRRLPSEDLEEWEQRVRDDIQTAQQRIEQEIGVSPKLFAYPYGEYRPALAAVVRSLGLVGFGQQSGPVWSTGDFTVLPRFPMAAGYADISGFRLKIRTLPMPLSDAEPDDPLVPVDEWRPRLRLVFTPGDYRFDELRCFVNGSDDVRLRWSGKDERVLYVEPGRNLQIGRNRYNCTMPTKDADQYHWYSHNWIRRKAGGGWYKE